MLAWVSALAADLPFLFPIHPQTRKNIESFGLTKYLGNTETSGGGGMVRDPLGYLDFFRSTTRRVLS
jgi:UDP-N-acetylglucosamine 2-epimerase (non-hydrolysing)